MPTCSQNLTSPPRTRCRRRCDPTTGTAATPSRSLVGVLGQRRDRCLLVGLVEVLVGTRPVPRRPARRRRRPPGWSGSRRPPTPRRPNCGRRSGRYPPSVSSSPPVNCSIPPDTRPRVGLPLKNRVTAGSSHTDPIDETTARVLASAFTDSSVGFAASNSATRSDPPAGPRWAAACARWPSSAAPRRMVGQVVIGVGPNERREVRHRLEGVEVLVACRGTLPFVAGVAPAGEPTVCKGHPR